MSKLRLLLFGILWLASPFLYGFSFLLSPKQMDEGLPLYYWQQASFVNFGDYISAKLVERITDGPVAIFRHEKPWLGMRKLLAIGSILSFGRDGDVVWGTGVNGKLPQRKSYLFNKLDVRAVRGPFTHLFLSSLFGIEAPKIYGDPALLFPYFFPEFKRKENPSRDYTVIPHYSENRLFPKEEDDHVIYATDPWEKIISQILDSQFVIASSLHGIIIAEAYGIPARWLRITENEPELKYHDYYLGTNRTDYQFATSIEEALEMGGVAPFQCDLEQLYDAFPFEFWPNRKFKKPNFSIPPGEMP